MSADLPLTTHELATIRTRCEAALRDRSPQRATVLATRLTYDVPRLVAEIERLRAEIDAWHVHTKSHPAGVGCVDDGDGKCRYCGTDQTPPPIERGNGPIDGVFKRP